MNSNPVYTTEAPDGRKMPFWEIDTRACEQYTGYTLLSAGIAGKKVYIVAISKNQEQLLELASNYANWSLMGISDAVFTGLRR